MDCSRTEESYLAPQPPRDKRQLGTNTLRFDLGIDYEYLKLYGRSDLGDLHQYLERFTSNKVIVRCFDNVCKDTNKGKEVVRDLILLKSLRHPCILNVVDVISLPDSPIYIVYEYAQANLKNLFKSPIHLEMIHVKTLMYKMLVALKYIHSASVVHGKLEPMNVLINEDCSLRLRDFGQAKCLKQAKNVHIEEEKSDNEDSDSDSDSDSDTHCNLAKDYSKLCQGLDIEKGIHPITKKFKLIPKKILRESQQRSRPLYEAPETLFPDQDQTPAVDIWSLGCLFAELIGMIKENAPTFLDRCPLFITNYPYKLRDNLHAIIGRNGTLKDDDLDFIQNQDALKYIKSIPPRTPIDLAEMYPDSTPDVRDLLMKMIQFNPHKRITVNECLNHPFFAGFGDTAVKFEHGGPITLDPRSEKILSPEELRNLLLDTMNEFKAK